MSRRQKGGIARKTEINMIPFLDVLLTMLLIFMIATPAVNRSIDVKVPPSKVAEVSEDINQKDIVVLEVHSDKTYTLFYNTDKYTDLKEDALQAQLERTFEELKAANKLHDLIVQVAADENAQYISVIGALDLLKGYGVVDVGLITKGLN